MKYIEVAVALPAYQTFTYSVPEPLADLMAIGKRVLVPFGRRQETGYVLGQSRYSEIPDLKKIKSVLDIFDEQPLFPSSMVPFFKWISDYYKYPVGQAIKHALPSGLNIRQYASLAITEKGQNELDGGQLAPIAKAILSELLTGSILVKDLSKKIDQDIPTAMLYTFERSGWITKKWKIAAGKTKARRERFVCLTDAALTIEGLSEARSKIIEVLKVEGEVSVKKLKTFVPTAATLIKALESDGYVSIHKKRVYRDPFGEFIEPDRAHQLNSEQIKAVDRSIHCLTKGYKTFLLRGVTGSGKTEVYMQVAAAALGSKRTVLVLVPEIALITQMERRFRARFGECVAVLHSALSAGERYDQWSRIAQGEATIAIGARSAIFAPFTDIGVIIVDEEHDASYKQEGNLRYNARDLATVRAKQNGCLAMLGSATPSIQSYYNVVTKKFSELTLKTRVEKRPMPDVKIVDLRETRDMRGIRRFITTDLQLAMKAALERDEQILLFLNRRGYASFPVCGACGQPLRCKHCDITLTLHRRANAFRCHYCGFSRSGTSKCEFCGSTEIRLLGLGTEKLETMAAALFPKASIARMDRDTTQRKGSLLKLLKGLKNKTTDILIGTQMVAKGHDFPNITLVGIICADLSLSFPDFRAGERTFQLLAQVSGRAGRGNRLGKVVLQTYNPEHFSIASARQQDYMAFYRQEIGFRKTLNYPPFSRMIQLKISGKDAQIAENQARQLGNLCRELKTQQSAYDRHVEIMGPIEASLTRIAGRYRWQILLKGLNAEILHKFINRLLFENLSVFGHHAVQVAIDVDPIFMM